MADENKHEEYLDKFLTGGDAPKVIQKSKQAKEVVYNNTEDEVSTLEYINVNLEVLPAGRFYKSGTKIKIKSASVVDVQAYSVIDDGDSMNITEKLNEMLSSCVRYIHPDGTIGSYKNVKDADRVYLILMIRELTFQNGNTLAKDIECEKCHKEFKIPYRTTPNATAPATIVNNEMPSKLEKYFDPNIGAYKRIINGVEWKIAPPTIGVQEVIFDIIKKRVAEKKKPNEAFLVMLAHLLYDREKISDDGVIAKEKEFKNMNMETFQVLNQMVKAMKSIGIKELSMKCECEVEVHTPMTFPDGYSSIFIISDDFDDVTEE